MTIHKYNERVRNNKQQTKGLIMSTKIASEKDWLNNEINVVRFCGLPDGDRVCVQITIENKHVQITRKQAINFCADILKGLTI